MSETKQIQMPQVEHLYYINVACDPAMQAGKVDGWTNMIIPIIGGRFEGERLQGTVRHIGADWNTLKKGVKVNSRVRTRYVLETDDGAIISLFTDGRMHGKLATMIKLQANKDRYPEGFYFRQHLYFTTGDPRYAWLNHAVAFAIIGLDIPNNCVFYDAYVLK